MSLDGDPRLTGAGQQTGGVLGREQGGGDVVGRQNGGVAGVGVPQHQNIREQVRRGPRHQLPQQTAQRHRLLQTGHRKGATARRQQGLGHGTDAVAVGVGFHHRYGVGGGGNSPDGIHQGVKVMGQRLGVDDGPRAGVGQEREALV